MASPPGLRSEKKPQEEKKQVMTTIPNIVSAMKESDDSEDSSDEDYLDDWAGSPRRSVLQKGKKNDENTPTGFSSLIKRDFFNRQGPKRAAMDLLHKEVSFAAT